MIGMANLQREVWEGWTPQDFIDELEPMVEMVMSGHAILKPIKSREKMTEYIKYNQPYYKKVIPEVNSYFFRKYNL